MVTLRLIALVALLAALAVAAWRSPTTLAVCAGVFVLVAAGVLGVCAWMAGRK